MAATSKNTELADVLPTAIDMPERPQSSDSVEIDEKKKYRDSQPEGSASFGDYVRIFSYASKGDLLLLAAAILASIGAGITLPLMNIVFGNLVGTLNNYSTPNSTSTEDEFNKSIDQAALYIVYLFIAKFLLCYISMFSFRIISTRLSAAIRLDYLKALFAQSVSELDKLPPGEAASTITSAANTLQIGISDKMGTFFQFTALLIGAYVIAFRYSWKLTLVTSSVLLFVVAIYCVLIPIWLKIQKSIDHANGKASSIASETFSSIRMVAACGAEQRVSRRYSGWVEESRRRGLTMSPIFGIQLAPVFFTVFADYALTFWFGARLYDSGDIASVSTVLIVLMSVLMGVMTLGNVIAPITAATKATTAASTFWRMIDKPTIQRGGLKEPDISPHNDIILDDVTFAYPSRPHVKVLDRMSVVFETGKLTAVVGPSGSGKSTIVGLIERWYEVSSVQDSEEHENAAQSDPSHVSTEPKPPINMAGTIKCGETSLKDTDLKWWRSQIGFVQQEPFIFNDTIFANVAYGLVGSRFENVDEEEKTSLVHEACKEAFADEFVNKLPEGYETLVGDSGLKLSGGQRQRIAIARSIIKRPQILIFDEATSAIDVRAERIVQAALDRVAQHRTTITIAHRLSTIKKADKIIVVAKGKVVEQGTHDELVQNANGVYHGLVTAQKITMGDDTLEILQAQANEAEIEIATKADDEVILKTTPFEDVPYKLRGLFRSFGLLVIEQKAHLHWLYLTLLGAIGAGAAFPVQAYLFAQIISIFQYLRGDPALPAGASYWALRFVYLAIGVGAGYFIMGWASNSLSIHVSSSYRQQYFESIIQKPIRFFDSDQNSSGTLVSRVANDPTQLQELMGINMGMVCIAMFSLIGCVAIAFSFGWKLTLVALCAALPLTFVAGYFRLRYEVQFEKLNAAVFAESSQFAAEAFGAVRTVTSLTLEDLICARYALLLQNHVTKATRKARFTTLIFALSDSINLLCMALTFWYGGRLLATHEYNVVDWLVIYIAVIQGSEAAGQWCGFGPNIAQSTAAANRILSLRVKESSTGKAPATEILQSEGGVSIDFRNVHFQYPSRPVAIFSGLNLTIHKGQFAALVGASGCGKSTIVSLLEQFYEVQGGMITCDGINIANLEINEYRKAISLVAQEATLFQGTIRENILLGVEEGTVSEEEVYQACRDAEIHDFINSLTDGYNTDIGSKGVALSGGQKQRIAIARALIRNPRILLLDEATSSLDSESEKLVQSAFERAGQGRTMVVVAHRLATVQNADVIFVLGSAGEGAGARVLEKGNHGELLANRGVYFQMCQSQALDW